MRSSSITVHNPDTGESKTFGPEDELPAWATKAVKAGNPDALKDVDDPDEVPTPGPGQTEADDLIGGGDEGGEEAPAPEPDNK